MGTSYYFYPKGFDKLDEINNLTQSSLEEIRNNYVKTVTEMIEKAKEINPEYENMFDLKEHLKTLNSVQVSFRWELSIPEIHICKISGGWIPLLNKTEYYSNFDELETFYNIYKNVIELKDEYNNDVTFDELKQKLFSHLNDKNSHLNTTDWYYKDKYYKDYYGFEWTTLYNWS